MDCEDYDLGASSKLLVAIMVQIDGLRDDECKHVLSNLGATTVSIASCKRGALAMECVICILPPAYLKT